MDQPAACNAPEVTVPTYDYVCEQCASPFEVRESIAQHTERPARPCPKCGSHNVARRFTPVNVAVGSRMGDGPAPSCDAAGCCCCG